MRGFLGRAFPGYDMRFRHEDPAERALYLLAWSWMPGLPYPLPPEVRKDVLEVDDWYLRPDASQRARLSAVLRESGRRRFLPAVVRWPIGRRAFWGCGPLSERTGRIRRTGLLPVVVRVEGRPSQEVRLIWRDLRRPPWNGNAWVVIPDGESLLCRTQTTLRVWRRLLREGRLRAALRRWTEGLGSIREVWDPVWFARPEVRYAVASDFLEAWWMTMRGVRWWRAAIQRAARHPAGGPVPP